MNTRHGSLYIVCEGKATENNFINDFVARLEAQGISHIPIADIEIVPPPKNDDDEKLENARPVARRRRTAQLPAAPEPVIKGQPPLNWVEEGVRGLESHSEVWVIFDNDNHPGRQEAFQRVQEERMQGKNLNIVYSSLSFEYYMLQHFEYLYHRFEKTEHRQGKQSQNCCSTEPGKQPLAEACNGDLHDAQRPACINGYARRNNYWSDSKKAGVFAEMRSVWGAIVNAHRVKWNSIYEDWQKAEADRLQIYEQNPYLDTYRMMLRLMNLKSLEPGECVTTRSVTLSMTDNGRCLSVRNTSGRTLIIRAEDSPICRAGTTENGENRHEGNLAFHVVGHLGRKVLGAEEQWEINLADALTTPDDFCLMTIDYQTIYIKSQPEFCTYPMEFLAKFRWNTL